MKNIISCIVCVIVMASCSTKTEKGTFTLNGDIKNIPPQEVYLEEIYFSEKAPQVLDTAEVKDGKFTLKGIAPEEGMYRIRFAKNEMGYIFINDGNEIQFTADAKDSSLAGPKFNTPANNSMTTFLMHMEDERTKFTDLQLSMENFPAGKPGDSLRLVTNQTLRGIDSSFKSFIIRTLDTTRSPVLAMFVMGYTRDIAPDSLTNTVKRLQQDFPSHNGLQALIANYKVSTAPPAAPSAAGNIMAPEITMSDTAGKPFSLSSLKGKYVLIDFWASWCAPCRQENPNVVQAYNTFKDKNFIVLGVSLDEDKAAWLKAIKKDKLTWTHISELKGWETSVTNTYNFNSIPYNVLIDPSGKIIGSNLRGPELLQKLQQILP